MAYGSTRLPPLASVPKATTMSYRRTSKPPIAPASPAACGELPGKVMPITCAVWAKRSTPTKSSVLTAGML